MLGVGTREREVGAKVLGSFRRVVIQRLLKVITGRWHVANARHRAVELAQHVDVTTTQIILVQRGLSRRHNFLPEDPGRQEQRR